MSLQYGIGLAEETIIRLSNNDKSVDKLLHAWSEIDVMKDDDTTSEWFEAVSAWKKKYLKHSTKNHAEEYYQELIEDLKFICGGIISDNTKLIPIE